MMMIMSFPVTPDEMRSFHGTNTSLILLRHTITVHASESNPYCNSLTSLHPPLVSPTHLQLIFIALFQPNLPASHHLNTSHLPYTLPPSHPTHSHLLVLLIHSDLYSLTTYPPLFSLLHISRSQHSYPSHSQLNDSSIGKTAGSTFFTIVDDVSFAVCRMDLLIDQLHSHIGE
jgi:hypothetical protein